MSYVWYLPGPPAIAPAAGSAAAALLAQLRTSDLSGLLDMVVDPVTLDYVDTDDGEFLESADSRSIVMIMIEMRLGADFYMPGDGTNVKDRLESPTGEPVLAPSVLAETERVFGILRAAGIVADVVVREDVNAAGEFVLVCDWRDLASGSPVDLVYRPFQG